MQVMQLVAVSSIVKEPLVAQTKTCKSINQHKGLLDFQKNVQTYAA
jgi:hypothetical protein